MSILQELEKSSQSDAPSYIEFLYRYDPKKKQAFAFYEGDEDASFYHQFLLKCLDDDCELEEIVAGCKNNVLKLQREFDWNLYNNRQIVFFVDRDLSFWLDDPAEYGDNVFVTDGYSVENYVATVQGFRFWLLRFEGFARAKKQEIENMVAEYISLESKFKELMKPIMAMAVVAKKHDHTIALDDFKISKNLNFHIQNGQVVCTLSDDYAFFEKWRLKDEYKEEIKLQIEYFSEEKRHYSVRGKWILFFMAKLGEFMRLHPECFAPSLEKYDKITPTCAVPPTQCLSALAPHSTSKIPIRLAKFLEHTYFSYFKKAS